MTININSVPAAIPTVSGDALVAQIETARDQAQAARDAAEDAVQYDYLVADGAALAALTGMVAGQRAFVRATEHVWAYSGTAWVDLGAGPTASKAEQTAVADIAMRLAAIETEVGAGPTWVRRVDEGGDKTAILDVDFDSGRFWWAGTQYPSIEALCAAVGGLSVAYGTSNNAFRLGPVVDPIYRDVALSPLSEPFDIDSLSSLVKYSETDTILAITDGQLAISRAPGAPAVSQYCDVPLTDLPDGTTLMVEAFCSKNAAPTVAVIIGASTMTLPTISTGAPSLTAVYIPPGTTTAKIRITGAGNGTARYLDYVKIRRAIALPGWDTDAGTISVVWKSGESLVAENVLSIGAARTFGSSFGGIHISQSANNAAALSGTYLGAGIYPYATVGSTDNPLILGGVENSAAASISADGSVFSALGYRDFIPVMNAAIYPHAGYLSAGVSGFSNTADWTPAAYTTSTVKRVSYWPRKLSSISGQADLYTSRQHEILMLGDSFTNPTLAGAIRTRITGRNLILDGVGGSTLQQQAARLETEPGLWDRTIIIMDGGLEETLDYMDGLRRIVACCNAAGHARYVYVQGSCGNNTQYALGTALRDGLEAAWSEVAAYMGADRYMPTFAQMRGFGDGGATDNALVAQGLMPRSLTSDGLHENALGSGHRADIIAAWFAAHPDLLAPLP